MEVAEPLSSPAKLYMSCAGSILLSRSALLDFRRRISFVVSYSMEKAIPSFLGPSLLE